MKPNPGSPEAVAQNCTCPREENRGGEGVAHVHSESETAHFCVAADCSLHGWEKE